MHTVTKYLTALLAATALLAGSALAVSVPILTTPATENVGAGMATLILQSNAAGSGYFTLLAGTDALCGSGTQVKAGLDSSGAKALYRGSMTLTANTQSKYAVRNLTQSTAYTVCFTADSPSGSNLNENPLSVNLSTTAMTVIANPGWAAVGTAGFTSSAIYSAALSFAPDGSPYFGYVNPGGVPFVSKYAQPIWSISPGAGGQYTTGSLVMAIAPDGMPYVAYRGGASSFAPNGTVKKYNGTSWAQVATDFSTSASSISLAFAPDGSPYVAYKDGLASSKATVKRFNGTSWGTVGSAGFSNGQVDYISLAFAPDGTPYLAYQDASTTPTKKATVSQFDGTNWVVVGSAGFSAGQANGVTLAIAQDGTLYVAYADSTTSPIGMATVMKYDTSTWVNVGIAGFSAGAVQHSSLAIAPDGKPYLAYVDGGNSNKATVMMYDGSAWANAGNAGFTLGSTAYTALAFSLDGVPYVGFSDSVSTGQGMVMKLSPQQTHANVTVTTNVAGLGINVDGLDYTTPHTFAWATGSDHSISAHSPQLLFGESGTQYRFNDWSDGGGQTHSIATPNTNTTYTANFTRQYQLTGAVDSTSHGYWQFCILDCYTMSQNGQLWLDEGDRRVISAKAYDGFKFSNWTGSVDYPNSSPTLLVTMTGPKSVTANFTGIPKLAAKVIGKSGPDNNRVWTIALTNTGTGGPAINANITGMYYAVTSGKDCQIYGYYSFPIVVGEIPQGAQGSGVVNWINYAECPSSNRYTMVFSYDYQDASGHSYFGTTAFYSIQR